MLEKYRVHFPTKSCAGHGEKMIALDEVPAQWWDYIVPIQARSPKINTGDSHKLEKLSTLEHLWQKYFHLLPLPGYNVQQLHWDSLVLHQRQISGSHHTSFGSQWTRQ